MPCRKIEVISAKMDPKTDEGEGGYGESGNPMDQFHRNEAISVVANEGFLGEEEDWWLRGTLQWCQCQRKVLQSLYKNDDLGFWNSDIEEKKPSPSLLILDVVCVSIAGVGGSGEGVGGGGGSEVVESRVLGRVNGFKNQGFRGNKVGVIGGIGVELGNQFGNLSEIEDEGGNDGVMVKGIGQ